MMKSVAVFGIVAQPCQGANQGANIKAKTWGPKHCVSVSRKSDTGTCVLQTDCGNMNLDDVEFAFTCQRPGILQKHSFGKGGFDSQETFDTSVECDVCGLPSEVGQSLKQSAKKFLRQDKQISLHKQEPEADDSTEATTEEKTKEGDTTSEAPATEESTDSTATESTEAPATDSAPA